MNIYFSTHAMSLDNEAGIASGHRDIGLSPLGRRQAAELRDQLAGVLLDVVFCSSLRRSIETARIAFGKTHTIRRDPRLDEVDYGDYTGMRVRELEPLRIRHIEVPFPNGESYQQRIAMVQAFLEDIRQTHPSEVLLIIGHRATLWGLEVLLGGKALSDVIQTPFHWRPYWQYPLA